MVQSRHGSTVGVLALLFVKAFQKKIKSEKPISTAMAAPRENFNLFFYIVYKLILKTGFVTALWKFGV